MTSKSAAASLLAECADWLTASLAEWVDAADGTVDVAAGETALATHLQEVRRVTEKPTTLAVRDALRLQLAAQDIWNGTILAPWPETRRTLKWGTRLLATHLFLCSQHVFASPAVCTAHITHHPDEAERAILMCLKASKTLTREGRGEEAQQMLTWAASIAEACRTVPKAKTWQYALEVHFALFHVLWHSQQLEAACATAEKLGRETKESITYREALLECIYDIALRALDNAHATTEKVIGAAAATSSSLMVTHRCLQTLLALSLTLQRQTSLRSMKQQSFVGMTELQLSCSLLETGAYAEAAEAAVAAYEHLHTFEPLVVRLKAEALLRNTEEVLRLLESLCAEEAVTVTDLCALATYAIEADPASHERVCTVLQRRVQHYTDNDTQDSKEENRFRLACVLLHVHSDWSIRELLRWLTSEGAFDATFHRFFFCSLWRLGVDSVEAAAPTGAVAVSSALSMAVRWSCLKVAVTHFSDQSASAEERQCVLLDLAGLALEQAPAGDVPADEGEDAVKHSEMLVQSWALWQTYAGEAAAPMLKVPVAVAQAELAFLLDKREEALQCVQAVWDRDTEQKAEAETEGEAEAAHTEACITLLQFLLSRSLLVQAGDVARRCLPRLTHPSPRCALELAKVCAIGFLAAHEDTLLSEVAQLLVAQICPVLHTEAGREVLATEQTLWWCRFLWYVGDRLMEGDAAVAVRLAYTAVHLHRTSAASAEAVETEHCLLSRRLSALLETEFDLFVADIPVLTVGELRECHACLVALCRGNSAATVPQKDHPLPDEALPTLSAEEDRTAVTLALAHIELKLRQDADALMLSSTTIASLALTTLAEVPGVEVGDLEQVAAACYRAATKSTKVCVPLRTAALNVQLTAAVLEHRRASVSNQDGAVCVVLSMLYEAYTMADDAASRDSVYATLTQTLLEDAAAAYTLKALVHRQHNATAPATTQVARMAETALEFFAVEAWNATVQWNVMERREEVAKWRAWTSSVTDLLEDQNTSKMAIVDLASQMPLL